MPLPHLLRLLYTTCLLLLLPFACRKTDAPDNLDPDAVAEKFLALPAASSPEIIRVAEQLRHLNGKAGFLNQIAAQAGYPVWNKVLYHTATRVNAGKTTGTTAASMANGDTLLYIPLVPENTRRVSAFILARLDGAVHLQLHQSRDYARYGFRSLESSTHNADRLALQLMVLDQQVFGYTEFTLLDNRLFRNGTDTPSLTSSTGNRVLQLRLESEGTASVTSRSSAGHWEEGTVTHCTRPEKGSNGGRNAVGAENTSSAMSGPGWTCTTTVQYYFVPGDDDDGSGNPNTGSGGGSGGGTPPAGPQPCNATPELDNGLPPCPRGGEAGWIPQPPAPEDDETPCEVAQEWARRMDTLYAACNADSAVATITDLATQPKEKGFPIFRKVYVSASATHDTIIRGYFTGEMHTGTDSNINYTFTHGLYEIPVANLHTHPPIGYWAQSAADVYDLIDHKRKDSRYMGAFVVSYNGNRYALTVTDPAAADSFYRTKDDFLLGANFKEESEIEKVFKDARIYFRDKYKNHPDKDRFVPEFALAAVLKQFKTGIMLNKRDETGHFKPVIVSTVIPNINKPKQKQYIQDCL